MKYIVTFLFLVVSLSFGKSEQLIVDAQNFQADEKKGISTFSGNVKIKMGKDRLNANKVDIYFKSSKKGSKTAYKYEANGKVNFEIITKNKHYIGSGDKIIYFPQKEEYTVLGNGHIKEKIDKREIFGNKIYINQLSGEAKVSGNKNKPVRFIFNVERGK